MIKKASTEPHGEIVVPLDSRGRRDWSAMSDDELVAYAQKFVMEKKLRRKIELKKHDNGAYIKLYRRKDEDGVRLIDKVMFAQERRNWKAMSDKELVAYAQGYVDEKNIKNRQNLMKKDNGLFDALKRRKNEKGIMLIEKLEFEEDNKDWNPPGFYSKLNVDEFIA